MFERLLKMPRVLNMARVMQYMQGLCRVLNISEFSSVCLNKCLNMTSCLTIWVTMTEYCWMSLNMPENAWINCSIPGFSLFLIILYIWQCFEFATGIKYVRILNMLWHSYNNIIIIVANAIILEFLSARFVRPGAPQLTILPFFNTS